MGHLLTCILVFWISSCFWEEFEEIDLHQNSAPKTPIETTIYWLRFKKKCIFDNMAKINVHICLKIDINHLRTTTFLPAYLFFGYLHVSGRSLRIQICTRTWLQTLKLGPHHLDPGYRGC